MSRFQPKGSRKEGEDCFPIASGLARPRSGRLGSCSRELGHEAMSHCRESGDASQLGDQCPATGQLLWERGEGDSVSKQHCLPHLGSTASILGLIELLVNLTNHRESDRYEPVHLSGVFH